MTGYVNVTKEEFTAMIRDKIKCLSIEVLIVNGGQQTRAIQKAMHNNVEVRDFRNKTKNYPAVTIYEASKMKATDFNTVIYCFMLLVISWVMLMFGIM
jgi:hypothetical protein